MRKSLRQFLCIWQPCLLFRKPKKVTLTLRNQSESCHWEGIDCRSLEKLKTQDKEKVTVAAAAAAKGINVDAALSQPGGIFPLAVEQKAALEGFHSAGQKSVFCFAAN